MDLWAVLQTFKCAEGQRCSNDSSKCTRKSKIASPTHKISSPYALIVYIILYYIYWLGWLFSLGTVPSVPKTLIVPLSSFISHMWRQLSGVSMLLDYPTNQQSFCNSWVDESTCWIYSRACWCLLSCIRLREQLQAENLVLRLFAPAATGMGQGAGPFWGTTAGQDASALSVCLLDVGVAAAASLSAQSAGGNATFFSRQRKWRWDLHAGIQREQMQSHRLSDYMCMYANASMLNHNTTVRHRGSLPHTACRCSVQTWAGAPAAPHTHISCPPCICVVRLSLVGPPWILLHRPDGDKMQFNVVFFKLHCVSLVFTQHATILSANLGSF